MIFIILAPPTAHYQPVTTVEQESLHSFMSQTDSIIPPDFQTTAQANPTKVCTFAENSKITMGKMSKFTPAFKAKVAIEKKVG